MPSSMGCCISRAMLALAFAGFAIAVDVHAQGNYPNRPVDIAPQRPAMVSISSPDHRGELRVAAGIWVGARPAPVGRSRRKPRHAQPDG
jgi:hypothetical protein